MPVGPIRLQVNAIGLLVGIVGGVAIVALMFLRDTTFHSEADVLDVLSLRVLALVPLVVDDAERRRRTRRRLLTGAVAGLVYWLIARREPRRPDPSAPMSSGS